MKFFKDLYNYRELLKTSVKKDIGGKYKHSFLGVCYGHSLTHYYKLLYMQSSFH